MERQWTSLPLVDLGCSVNWIRSQVLKNRVFATNYSANIMRTKMDCTESVLVVLQGLLALEYATTRSTHAQTISNNCLAFRYQMSVGLSCWIKGWEMNWHSLRVPSGWRKTRMQRSHACHTALGWPLRMIHWLRSSIAGLKRSAWSLVCGTDNSLPLRTPSSSKLRITNESHTWFVVRLLLRPQSEGWLRE